MGSLPRLSELGAIIWHFIEHGGPAVNPGKSGKVGSAVPARSRLDAQKMPPNGTRFFLAFRVPNLILGAPSGVEAVKKMSAGNRKSADRVAATLFALLKSATGRHRVLAGDHQATRKAVNTLLEQLGDNVLTETLHELYRIAEADARKRACGSAIALGDRLHPKRIILDPPPNPER